jgi:hypothetical protein
MFQNGLNDTRGLRGITPTLKYSVRNGMVLHTQVDIVVIRRWEDNQVAVIELPIGESN